MAGVSSSEGWISTENAAPGCGILREMRLPPVSPLLTTGRVDRRALLKVAGVGGAALLLGAWAWRTLRGFGPPGKGLRAFDESEWQTVVAYTEAMFPGPPDWPLSAKDARVAEFVDLWVAALYEDTQQLFRMLVRTLALSTLVSHGRAFRFLTVAERRAVLDQWAESDLRVRRAGYQSLSFPAHLGYLEDERVRAAEGLELGCDLSAFGPRPSLWTAAPPGAP